MGVLRVESRDDMKDDWEVSSAEESPDKAAQTPLAETPVVDKKAILNELNEYGPHDEEEFFDWVNAMIPDTDSMTVTDIDGKSCRSTKIVPFKTKYDLYWTTMTIVQNKDKKKKASEKGYETHIAHVAHFSTLQEFWRVWNGLSESQGVLSVSKDEVQPKWEDPALVNGGRFIFNSIAATERFNMWTDLSLVMMGGTLQELCEKYGDEILSVHLSLKKKGCQWKVEVWNKKAGTHVREIDLEIRRIVNVTDKEAFTVEYKSFDGAQEFLWKNMKS